MSKTSSENHIHITDILRQFLIRSKINTQYMLSFISIIRALVSQLYMDFLWTSLSLQIDFLWTSYCSSRGKKSVLPAMHSRLERFSP